jgi:hypothetical protein
MEISQVFMTATMSLTENAISTVYKRHPSHKDTLWSIPSLHDKMPITYVAESKLRPTTVSKEERLETGKRSYTASTAAKPIH